MMICKAFLFKLIIEQILSLNVCCQGPGKKKKKIWNEFQIQDQYIVTQIYWRNLQPLPGWGPPSLHSLPLRLPRIHYFKKWHFINDTNQVRFCRRGIKFHSSQTHAGSHWLPSISKQNSARASSKILWSISLQLTRRWPLFKIQRDHTVILSDLKEWKPGTKTDLMTAIFQDHDICKHLNSTFSSDQLQTHNSHN